MPKCFVKDCSEVVDRFKDFRRHMRGHGVIKDTPVYCVDGNCKRIRYSNLFSLIRHFKDAHASIDRNFPSRRGTSPSRSTHEVNDSVRDDVSSSTVVNEPSVLEEREERRGCSCEENSIRDFASLIHNEAELFLAKMYSNQRITRNHVQDVVEYNISLLHGISSSLKPLILNLISESVENFDEASSKVEEICSILEHPFDDLKTEYLRLKTFEEEGTFVKPQPVEITAKFGTSTRSNKKSHGMQILTADFIPLRLTLKSFLEQPGVMSRILKFKEKVSKDEPYTNFMNGQFWKHFDAKGKFLLPIFLHSDEFHTGDSWGSHKGIHKLTGIYAGFPFLPPEIFSNLRNIFIVYLHHSADRSLTTNKDLYECVIKEFLYLYNEGVTVSSPDYTGKINFSLALFLGDNLGMHQMLGFSEGFTATHPCRMCLIHHDKLLSACTDDESLRRNKDNYDLHLAMNNFQKTGIKEKCAFNGVSDFHCTTNAGVDVMHDAYEGVCLFTLKVVISYFIENKYFTLDELNQRIEMFDYGLVDKSLKPPPSISIDKGSLVISMSAAETLIFTKYFGLLVGDLVLENNIAWELYILLRQILDIILSPFIPPDHLRLLASLIEEHHSLYLKLSEDKRLKNKHHHFVHYVHSIIQFGPLVHYSSMMFEMKHIIGKSIAVNIMNNENLTFSIAMRAQLAFWAHLKLGLFDNKNKCGPATPITVSNLDGFERFSNQVPDHTEKVEVVSWVEINGTEFKPDMVLVTDYEDELPQFSVIRNIVIDSSENIAFVCLKLRTLYFHTHFHCFEVESSRNIFEYVQHADLLHEFPTVISTSPCGSLFVTYRYGL